MNYFKPNKQTQSDKQEQYSNSSASNETNGKNNNSVPHVSLTPLTPGKLTEPSIPSEMDAYKTLSSVERGIIKKVLSVINSMSDIPEKQKHKLKTKLQKKIVKK